MKSVTVFFCLSLALCLPCVSRLEGWRGIVPLHSTRADVERLLGKGSNECGCSYYLEDVNVHFIYSSGDCKSGGSGGWNIPPDTVIRFSIYPKEEMRFSDLKIDKTKYRKQNNPELKDIAAYVDEQRGLMIEINARNDLVMGFYYGPAAKDEHLRCPESKSPKEVFRQKRLDEILSNQKPQSSELGIPNIRDDSRYEIVGPFKLEVEFDEEETLKNRATIRQFLWEHWQKRRLGYVEMILFTAIRGVSNRSVFIEPDENGLWQIVVERSGVLAIDKSSGKDVFYGAPKIAFDVVERIEPTEDGTSPIVLIPETKTLKPNEYMLRLRNSRTGEEAIW